MILEQCTGGVHDAEVTARSAYWEVGSVRRLKVGSWSGGALERREKGERATKCFWTTYFAGIAGKWWEKPSSEMGLKIAAALVLN